MHRVSRCVAECDPNPDLSRENGLLAPNNMKPIYMAARCCTIVVLSAVSVAPQSFSGTVQSSQARLSRELGHTMSPPLRALARSIEDRTALERVESRNAARPSTGVTDFALQPLTTGKVSTTWGTSFTGLASDGWTVPDSNGAVSSSQYVEYVNSRFAVYDKSTGTLLSGPIASKRLWAALGGGCAAANGYDVIVL